jgi:hypothetical protein
MKKIFALFLVIPLAVLSFGQLGTVSVKTADYAVLPTDHGSTIIMNSASARTIYLPGPAPAQIGMTITVQKRGAGNVTIQAAAADYIADSGVGQYIRNTTATETYASITLVYAQTNRWQVIGAFGTWATDVSTYGTGLTVPVSSANIAAALSGKTYNGLTPTAAAVGFTLAGGTTPKTFTLTGDSTINQSLDTTASPTFRAGYLAYAKSITAGANDDYPAAWRSTPAYVGDGIIATVAVNAGGTLYHVSDVLDVAGGTGGQVTVSTIDGDAHVTGITIDTPGTGYTVSTQACSGGNGAGFVADITAVDAGDGHLDTVGISVAGLGYHVGDLLDVAGGTGGKLAVATVDGTGTVTAVTVSAGGTGYDATAAHATTGGAGSGCTIDISTLTARTIAGHNYFDLLTPAVSKGAAVTNAFFLRFDANAGTHKAIDAASGLATSGWAKVNINGTAGYIPVMASTSAVGTFNGFTGTQVGADPDFDTDEVLVTTWAGAYGLLIVQESTGNEAEFYWVANTTLTPSSAEATFTTTKDNASTYNTYFEGGVLKVQNKVGDNKNLRVAFIGIAF